MVEPEGFEPSSRLGTGELSTCLALFELSGIDLEKCTPFKTLFPLSRYDVGTKSQPAQKNDTHCKGLMSRTPCRVACSTHLVNGIRRYLLEIKPQARSCFRHLSD